MSADVTDELLLQAGKRLEAAILPGQTFMNKSAGAFGALLAGTLLTLIAYPSAIDTAQVSPRQVDNSKVEERRCQKDGAGVSLLT